MAEGHAVARWGDALRQLIGERVDDIEVPTRWRERADHIRGAELTLVRTHGKHLVLYFSSDWVVHAHAMQYGSWQIGPIGQELRKEARFARLRLRTSHHEAVFFHGPVMEVLSLVEFAEHERFHSLGPDLLHDDFSPAGLPAALHAHGDREIGDAILDQRIVAGIGNIYKSESLFASNVNPFAKVSDLNDEVLRRIVKNARSIMRRAAMGGRDRKGVYERSGDPCRVCGATILYRKQGPDARGTHWCPKCQPL